MEFTAAGAAGAFYDGTGANPLVEEPAWLRHLGQPEFDLAVAGAVRRDLGDRWLWDQEAASVDISPLVAVTLALWGAQTAKPPPKPMLVVSNPDR